MLALVLAISLAGCGGFLGEGNSPRTTLTPAPVPTESAPEPPGVDDGRLIEPAELLVSHASATVETSYTARRERVERFGSGEVRSRTSVTVRQAADGGYRVSVTSSGAIGDEREYYYDETVAYLSARFGNRTTYSRAYTGNGSPPLPKDLLYFGTAPYRGGRSSQWSLFRYVTVAEGSTVSVSRPTENRDWFRYRVRTGSLPNAEEFAEKEGVDTVENVSIGVSFDDQGIVRSYTVRYTGEAEGRPVTVEETLTFTDVGSTVVEAPDWPIIDE